MGEFGDKFRKAREKKELSFDDVSNVTKISSRMLQAIEEEHFDQLPGGVFNKGFIRAYAKHLGLNSEDAITDYLACLRQAQIDSHAAWDAEPRNGRQAATPPKAPEPPVTKVVVNPQAKEEQVEELPELQLPRAEHIRPGKKEYLDRPTSGPPWSLIGIAAVVVVLAGILWIRHSRATHSTVERSSTSPVTVSAAEPSSVAAPPVAPSVQLPATATQSAAASGSKSSALPTANAQPLTDKNASAAARRTPPVSTPSADASQVKVERKGDVTIRSFGEVPSKPAEETTAKLTLVVRASENSWISVTSDGQLVTQETLIAPAATSFHANRELIVRVGNAAGVSFLWNGEELPPQGAEAEAKTFTFDAQGMRASTPSQPSAQN